MKVCESAYELFNRLSYLNFREKNKGYNLQCFIFFNSRSIKLFPLIDFNVISTHSNVIYVYILLNYVPCKIMFTYLDSFLLQISYIYNISRIPT